MNASYHVVIVVWAIAATSMVQAADPVSLVDQFNAAKPEQRATLVDQLGRRDIDSVESATVLQHALRDPSAEVRWRAARAMSTKSDASETMVASLVAALDDNHPQVRAYAAHALGRVAVGNVVAAKALAQHVTDESALVRRESIAALSKLNVSPALVRPVIVSALQSGDPEIVASAITIMASMGDDVVEDLQAALEHEDANYWASLVIQEMGPAAAATVPQLRKVLGSPHGEERLEAVLALAAVGEAARPAAPDLARLLANDPVPGVRTAAAFALGKLQAARVADEQLTAAATSDRPVLRLVSTWAMHKIYPDNSAWATSAAKLILEGIKSDDAQLRSVAARTLAESEVTLEQAAPYIAAALQNSHPDVVELAVKAIIDQGDEALPELRSGLQDARLQIAALRIVQRLGAKAVGLLDSVQHLTAADDPQVRREALFALASMGEAAAPAADAVAKALSAETIRDNQLAAVYAAGQIGRAAEAVRPQLLEWAANEEASQVRLAALWALARIEPENEEAIAQAVSAMSGALANANHASAKIALANALAELGPRARPAAAVLEKLLDDPDPRVRQAAEGALEALAP